MLLIALLDVSKQYSKRHNHLFFIQSFTALHHYTIKAFSQMRRNQSRVVFCACKKVKATNPPKKPESC